MVQIKVSNKKYVFLIRCQLKTILFIFDQSIPHHFDGKSRSAVAPLVNDKLPGMSSSSTWLGLFGAFPKKIDPKLFNTAKHKIQSASPQSKEAEFEKESFALQYSTQTGYFCRKTDTAILAWIARSIKV